MVLTIIGREEICQGFSELGITLGSENVVNKLQELCQTYNKDAIALADEWFAFITSTHLDSQPNEESLTKFESDRLIERIKITKTPKTPLTTPRTQNKIKNASNRSNHVDDLLKAYGTPEALENVHSVKKLRTATSLVVSKDDDDQLISDSPSTISSSSIYATRSRSGDIIDSFGKNEIEWTNVAKENNCSFSFYDEIPVLTESYKYMFEKHRVISTVINSKIEALEDVYKQDHNIEEFANLALISTEEVAIVGQICCDGNGKLNTSSVLIEGSHKTSTGLVASLSVHKLSSFSFFPGQISALQALNNGNLKWTANSVLPLSLPPPPNTSFLLKENLSFVIASGPFTTLDSLSYKPLEDFLEKLTVWKPHVCILIGPFVDIRRKENEGEMIDITYDDLFDKCMGMIKECQKNVTTKFVIVSSSNDAHHDFIYPTPPYTYENAENIYFVPDPCLINFNGVVLGVTATDILFHLGKQEITHPPGTPDRFGRLASHLLSQRSFYPLYPPSEGLNVNLDKLQVHAQLPITPHFLILPSDFFAFIKNMNGCCCVNPRRLTCGNDGGTYARIVIDANVATSDTSFLENVSVKIISI